MSDVQMNAAEAFFILKSLNVTPEKLAKSIGHQSHATLVYRMQRSRVTPLLARLMRAAYEHPDAGYLALIEESTEQVVFADDAPLRRFVPGRHIGTQSRVTTAREGDTPGQRELRRIFAALNLSQSDAADALGLTRAGVSLWFAQRRGAAPLTVVTRILRVAMHTDLLTHMRSATPAVPPPEFTLPFSPPIAAAAKLQAA